MGGLQFVGGRDITSVNGWESKLQDSQVSWRNFPQVSWRNFDKKLKKVHHTENSTQNENPYFRVEIRFNFTW